MDKILSFLIIINLFLPGLCWSGIGDPMVEGKAMSLNQAPMAFSSGDTTPDISAGFVFVTANIIETAINSFDWGGRDPINGTVFFLVVGDDKTIFDFMSLDSTLEGMNNNYKVGKGDLSIWSYTTSNSKWHYAGFPKEINVTMGGMGALKTIVTDIHGNLVASKISSTKIGYLCDVTENIQTLLDAKKSIPLSPIIQEIQLVFDPGTWYDSDTERRLLDLSADCFPNGIVITKWFVEANVADPDVEMSMDLMCCDSVASGAFPGPNPTLVDVMDTIAGNSSETINSNMTNNGIVSTGKSIYLLFRADPEGNCAQLNIRICYYIPES